MVQTKKQKRETARIRYAKFEANGMCNHCGKHPPDEGLNKCSYCRNQDQMNKHKNWLNVKINHCKESDKRYNRKYKEEEYLTGEDITTLQEQLHDVCVYCNTPLQTDDMSRHDGLTIERINNNQAHVKGNCTLACWKCNNKKIGSPSKYAKTRKERKEYLNERRTRNAIRAMLNELIAKVSQRFNTMVLTPTQTAIIGNAP